MADQFSRLYDADYYESMRGDSAQSLFLKFVGLMRGFDNTASDPTILDLGCGRGDLLEILVQQGYSDIYGLDFSSEAVREAQRRLAKHSSALDPGRIYLGSAADSSYFKENMFHVIFMTDVVEHLPPATLKLALENARFWLKPGGRLIIHTFPTLGPHRIFQGVLWIIGRWRHLRLLNQIHCNPQSRRRLDKLLADIGFSQRTTWLENTFTLTSSAYKQLPEGILKSVTGWFFDNFMKLRLFVTLSRLLGLEEFVFPSIYVVCEA